MCCSDRRRVVALQARLHGALWAGLVAFAVSGPPARAADANSSATGPKATVAPADWLQRSREILDEAARQPVPDWLRREPDAAAQARVKRMLPQAVRPLAERTPLACTPTEGAGSVGAGDSMPALIFVSAAMPEAELRAALAEASARRAVVVFRGIRPGSDLAASFIGLQGLASGLTPVPEVVLDPTLFSHYNISAVPTIVVRGQGGNKDDWVAVPGTLSLPFAESRLQRGDRGPVPAAGALYAIAEPDLLDEITRRAAQIDWERQKSAALASFWARDQGIDLPAARETVRRRFDPSLTVTRDVVLPDGRLLARAGARFNPQAVLPLSKVVVVFDAASAPQRAIARQAVAEARAARRGFILIASRLPAGSAPALIERNEREFQAPLYVLSPQLVTRFGLQRLPTILRSAGDQLLLTEVAVRPAAAEGE